MLQKPRGTMDVLPEEVAVWQKIEKTAAEVAGRYGFSEIRFPSFEATELFARGVGDTTDVVQKEMYSFTDRDGRSLTLRPEGTACVVRSLIENGKCGSTMPLKLYYLINCFRYEKPQAGRSREFYQFGVEMFGAGAPAADTEVILLGAALLRELGVKAELKINSIGCPDCRPKYREALRSYFESRADELCETCRGRLASNPLRILDCKSPVCSEIAAGAPKLGDYLCDGCRSHMKSVLGGLDAAGVSYTIDEKLVRGLDYYTRTVFEYVVPAIGAQSSVGGGGRYDGLVSELGGSPLAGLGFAMGITRIILAMKAEGITVADTKKPAVYIAPMGAAATAAAVTLTEELRRAGIYAECDTVGRSIKAQFKYADKIGAEYTVALGDTELSAGRAELKSMTGKENRSVSVSDAKELINILSGGTNNG